MSDEHDWQMEIKEKELMKFFRMHGHRLTVLFTVGDYLDQLNKLRYFGIDPMNIDEEVIKVEEWRKRKDEADELHNNTQNVCRQKRVKRL